MALTTYAGLKASVATFYNRSDLTTVIPDFVSLAESLIRKKIEARSMETVATGTLTGETLAQPSGLLETRRLNINDDGPLNYCTPEQYDEFVVNTLTGGKYTVIGSNYYILGGASGDTYELVYNGAFTALAADADTNFVLTNAPEVYLWASLHYAAVYMKDVEGATNYLALFMAAADLFNAQEKKAKYSGGSMTIRAETRE